ncbi:MAG TPA: CHAT domain-containing protein [Sporichthya sp.]|nr:CHAT domain-containing protein [Sporichthya sp.]
MDERGWRTLAQLAIDELDELLADEETRTRVREQLRRALDLPGEKAIPKIREVLTSQPPLRMWIERREMVERTKLAEGALQLEQVRPAPDRPTVVGQHHGGTPAVGGSSGRSFLAAGGHIPGVDLLLDVPPPAPWTGDQKHKQHGSHASPKKDTDEKPRFWRADVQDYDAATGLTVGTPYVLGIGVSDDPSGATGSTVFDDAFMDKKPGAEIHHLTVQIASDDFDIAGEGVQSLRVPRTGPSPEPTTFVITPRRDGACVLTATVHLKGNFLTILDLTLPVGRPGAATLTKFGRPPESIASLVRRDLLLWLRPSALGVGYDLQAGEGVFAVAHLPISTDELAFLVDDVQKAMYSVVSLTHDGTEVFTTGLDIPEPVADQALTVLARAGALLFSKLFLHPQGGEDLKRIGAWLRVQATKDDALLKIQIVALDAPIPWSMLYLGDTRDDATLDWDKFLGMRHVVDQIPLQQDLEVRDVRITSRPRLTIGLNVSETIDRQYNVTYVGEHVNRWTTIAGQRRRLVLVPRSTRESVVAALDDAHTSDQIEYFLCHAKSAGTAGNPGDAYLDLGQGGPMTLRELESVVPPSRLGKHPLVFLNACESADLTPRFYAGFVPYFVNKGARGVIGTECKTPVVFAVGFAEAFFERLLDGHPVGESVLFVRRELLRKNRNPLGLIYAVHCDADTRIEPALTHAGH